MSNASFFKIIHQSKKSKARVGQIITPHGIIDTPNFVPVGTNGTLKAVDMITTQELGVDLMFCNTYHLMLQPGADLIQQAGGIHAFTRRKKPIITDSGGFQVFSLAYGNVASELKSKGQKKINSSVLKLTEEGATFRSYRDGRKILLTPEGSIQAQKKIGADIILAFDELPPYHTSPQKLKHSFDRTHRWEERSLQEHLKNPQGQIFYGIIHGGIDYNLRKQSCTFLAARPFDGMAIGGSVGKNRNEMVDMLSALAPHLPPERPRHLLGIGDIPSLHASIPLGIDTFDSAHPTKAARHGLLFTRQGNRRIAQAGNAQDHGPIEKECRCYTCTHYSMAYLNHLFKAKEPAILTLASIHNIYFMMQFMADYRTKILNDEV